MSLSRDPLEILLPDQMSEADRLTIEGGIPGYDLMEKAGEAVARAAQDLLEEQTGSSASGMVCILCGPGNNGGDGLVAARLLEEEGWSAIVGCSVEVDMLRGDARLAADDWGEEIYPLSSGLWQDADLVIDALFGAGLDRPVTGELSELVDKLNESSLPVLSVDLPSGVEGASGLVRGA
ncbi:MAG TPA: NAD(P)H-hydrate epimerase, partial [Rhizobiales bacterium]|nr:NAD(P)H-hydrate epimerase [Hyphomicrobiales bacterium]